MWLRERREQSDTRRRTKDRIRLEENIKLSFGKVLAVFFFLFNKVFQNFTGPLIIMSSINIGYWLPKEFQRGLFIFSFTPITSNSMKWNSWTCFCAA